MITAGPELPVMRQAHELPPHLLDILAPTALYSLGLTGMPPALTGAILPARRAARSRVAEILQYE